jgi:hypothetical protein
MTERDQQLLEGPIGSSGWRYRTGRMPGHLDFLSPDSEAQPVGVAGAEILEVRPLHERDREVLVITAKTERVYRRGDDDLWREEGMRPRTSG